MTKKNAPAPMPEVGSIIEPLHNREQVAWWEKTEKPQGKFVRIIWDKESNKHSAVCRHNFTMGIIAFIVGRPPGFGDILKVVSVGENTCRVVAISRYHDVAKKVIEKYEAMKSSDEPDPIDIICSDILEEKDIVGFNIAEMSAEEQLATQAMLSWGVLQLLEHGDPPEYKD